MVEDKEYPEESTIRVTAETLKKIDELKEYTGLLSTAEVVRMCVHRVWAIEKARAMSRELNGGGDE